MTELRRYLAGDDVRCSDGVCGKVSRIVVDPATLTVTHLVVEPDDRHQLGRLVPFGLVDAASGAAPDGVSLRCTTEEFFRLAHAEEAQFVRGTGDFAGYDQGRPVRFMPRRPGGASSDGTRPRTFTYDVLPAGEVGQRGGDPAHALDGAIGHLVGVAIETGSRQLTYLLLRAGHPLGKNIAVPSDAVTRIDAGIWLALSKHDIKHLPPANLR